MLRKLRAVFSMGLILANFGFAAGDNRPEAIMGRWQMRSDNYEELKRRCYKKSEYCLTGLEDMEDLVRSSMILKFKKEGCDMKMDLDYIIEDFAWQKSTQMKEFLEQIKQEGDLLLDDKNLNWSAENNLVTIYFKEDSTRTLKLKLESATKMTSIKEKGEENGKEAFDSFYKVN